jgi:DNA-binding winged helix-turn-helix (wHTH) protein
VIARFGRFLLDDGRRQLLLDGVDVHLTPKAFEFLVLLVSEAPRVLSKSELHERLWPATYVSDATLVGLAKEVRRALAGVDTDASAIRTVHRVGYAFAATVDRHPSSTAQRVWHWLVLPSRSVALREGENSVGRDPESCVWLDAAGVSRRHARIQIDGASVRLEDLGSKNGTTLGEAPVQAPVALRDGDRIAFGSVTGVYRTSAAGMSTETQAREVRQDDPARAAE